MALQDPQPLTTNDAVVDPKPAIPDYLVSPNAVFKDEGVQWRYGRAPDYSKTRKVWEEGKRMNHDKGSLEEMVENLVKNWEVEASFKPRLSDWRTIDHEKYAFSMGGGPPMSAEHMIKVGTYNGIIAPNEYYSPENSDFASSHKTFKRMMPTFAWEVLEVYSGPPRVSFRWRHWGYMKNDYVGFNDKGEKVTAKAHGGIIDIEGVIVATVDDQMRLQDLQTWMDPLEMFRQIAPKGVVNKQTMNRKVDLEAALDAEPECDGGSIAEEHKSSDSGYQHGVAPEQTIPKHVSASTGKPADAFVPHQGTAPQQPSASAQSDTDTEQGIARDATEDLKHSTTRAQSIVDTAAAQGADAEIESPTSNFHDALEKLPEGQSLSSSLREDNPVENNPGATASDLPRSIYSSAITGNKEEVLIAAKSGDVVDESKATGTHDAIDEYLESSADKVHPHPKDTEDKVALEAGEAVVAAPDSEETRLTHEEMSRISPSECPFIMNRE